MLKISILLCLEFWSKSVLFFFPQLGVLRTQPFLRKKRIWPSLLYVLSTYFFSSIILQCSGSGYVNLPISWKKLNWWKSKWRKIQIDIKTRGNLGYGCAEAGPYRIIKVEFKFEYDLGKQKQMDTKYVL